MKTNPLSAFLERYGIVILDGALATELENLGENLNDPLWSAKVLIENPGLLKKVHLSYLLAGADIITTSTYQATFQGFNNKGVSKKQAEQLFRTSIHVAQDAIAEFWDMKSNKIDQIRPLIAASIGPFGAYLADGSEYTGQYGLTKNELIDFHRPRLEVLANLGADIFAFETIPSLVEAEALLLLLEEFPNMNAWMSFSCQDGSHISGGQRIEEAIQTVCSQSQIIAAGVNCTPPQHIESLIKKCAVVSPIPLIAYPNSGETWDAPRHRWSGSSCEMDFLNLAEKWKEAGAKIIGGCCRIGPQQIKSLARLRNKPRFA